MGFIIKVFLILFFIWLVITIFEKITGINITNDDEEVESGEKNSSFNAGLGDIEIAQYVVTLYQKPYAELKQYFPYANIDTIVNKYLQNQLFFSEEYENHVIILKDNVASIGKDDNGIYISIGNGDICSIRDSGGEYAQKIIKCYMEETFIEDQNYKNIILNMRPHSEVILVGVLGILSNIGSAEFGLYNTTLIKANGIIPDNIMNMAVNAIHRDNV